MGVINTLREKMGRFVVAAVGFSILAFVATDLLGPNSSILGGGQQAVGEIAGEEITYPEFVQEFERLKTNYTLSNNQSPTSDIQDQIREQAWNNFLIQKAYKKEFDAIGLKVTDEEKIDMVQGVNIHPSIVQSFVDESGTFDKSRVINFLQNFDQLDPQMQYNWTQFEQNLGPERMQNKMTALLQKSAFTNKYEALGSHVKNNASIEGRILYIPYFSIADSTVNVSDGLLSEVLSERKEEFKKTDNFSLDYVLFSVAPSEEDSLYFVEEMQRVARDFEGIKDDTSFIKLNSDISEFPTLYRPDELPEAVASVINEIDSGDVVGPIVNGQNLEVYKHMGIVADSEGEFAKASHILIKTDDGEAEAKRRATGILNQAKNGADFAELARENSDGPTNVKGGDLGWFGKGRMVAEFEEAVFSAKSEGLIPKLVKTQFGFHIINVTAVPSSNKFLLGKVTREITPSDETSNEVFRKADVFAGTAKSSDEFASKAAEMGLNIQTARNIGKRDRSINALQNVREVVRWAFTDASVGGISEVFEIDDNFMVALLTEKNEEGYADVDDVRERLMPIALKKVKAEEIMARINELNQEDLDALMESYGSNASIYDLNAVTFNTNTIRGAGFDPAAVGLAFGMEAGSVSKPIEGENGVMIFEINSVNPATAVENLTELRQSTTQQRSARAPISLSETVKEKAEIVDDRYRFF